MPAATDNIDERGHTLADVLAYTTPSDWECDAAVTLSTSANADDIVDTAAPHGFSDGDVIYFPSLTGGSNVTADQFYYVIAANLAAQTFQFSATPGGAAVNFGSDITAGTVRRLSDASAFDNTKSGMFLALSDAEVDAMTA